MTKRAWWGVLLALQAASSGAAARVPAATPTAQRVMSLSMCTDDLALDLLPPERIVSLTYYARQPDQLREWPAAATIAVNHGSAEEVLAAKPDLVLAGSYTTGAVRALLRSLHFQVLEVPPAENFAQIRAVTRQVAQALGREAAADELLARMDATLHSLAAAPLLRPVRVAAWGEGGAVPGRGTLFDAVLQAAGASNIAAESDAPYMGIGIEGLLMARPDVLVYASGTLRAPGRNTESALHPLLLERYRGRRINYDSVAVRCGIPQSAQAAVQLRAALQQAVAGT